MMTKAGHSAVRDRAAIRAPSVRTLVKRDAITEAAIRLFLTNGYRATSMDEVAAAAGVSKVTLYKQFGDKESLFTTIVRSVTARAETITAEIERRFAAIAAGDGERELGPALVALAGAYAAGVVAPEVVRLRRLVIAEAEHFPDLAAAYYDCAAKRALRALAVGIARLAELGLLRPAVPQRAAGQFAYVVLGPLIDRAMFLPDGRITRTEIAAQAEAGVAVFLAAYGPNG